MQQFNARQRCLRVLKTRGAVVFMRASTAAPNGLPKVQGMRYYVAALLKIAIARGAQLNSVELKRAGAEGSQRRYGFPSRSMADCNGASDTRTSPI